MSRPVLPKQLVKLHADLPRKSMRRLTMRRATSGSAVIRLPRLSRQDAPWPGLLWEKFGVAIPFMISRVLTGILGTALIFVRGKERNTRQLMFVKWKSIFPPTGLHVIRKDRRCG